MHIQKYKVLNRTCHDNEIDMTQETPFEILGVDRKATFKEIRGRYLELAKQYHPDRWMHSSAEERDAYTEKFKNIQSAYEFFEGRQNSDSKWGESDTFEHIDLAEWYAMWKNIHDLFANEESRSKVTALFKKSISNAISQYARTMTKTEEDQKTHVVQYHATLEDIHASAKKRVKVHLQNLHAVYVNIDCGRFPTYADTVDVVDPNADTDVADPYGIFPTQRRRKIPLKVHILVKPHAEYTHLYIDGLENVYDLKRTLPVHIDQYIEGHDFMLQHLGADLLVAFERFSDVSIPLIYYSKGLQNKGILYIYPEIVLPTRERWDMLCVESQKKTIEHLKLL